MITEEDEIRFELGTKVVVKKKQTGRPFEKYNGQVGVIEAEEEGAYPCSLLYRVRFVSYAVLLLCPNEFEVEND